MLVLSVRSQSLQTTADVVILSLCLSLACKCRPDCWPTPSVVQSPGDRLSPNPPQGLAAPGRPHPDELDMSPSPGQGSAVLGRRAWEGTKEPLEDATLCERQSAPGQF